MIRQLAALPDETVRECATGEDAVHWARAFAPDVVTMDVRLPGINGFAAAHAIRAIQPHTTIVMVSAYDQAELRSAAEIAGAAGYVRKDNLSELRSWLPARPAPAQPSAGARAPAAPGKEGCTP